MDIIAFLFEELRYVLRNYIPKISTKIESLPSEIPDRMIEYAFIMRELKAKCGRILDVGCTAPYNIIPLILAESGFEVCGIDIRDFKIRHPNFTFYKGDIRRTNFQDNFFDWVIAVSSIEHIGMKGRYDSREDPLGDRKAILEMIRILKKDGKILMTVPFGKTRVIGSSHRVYDSIGLNSLIKRLKIIKEEFYIKNRKGYWIKYNRKIATSFDSPNKGYAIACLKLTKAQ